MRTLRVARMFTRGGACSLARWRAGALLSSVPEAPIQRSGYRALPVQALQERRRDQSRWRGPASQKAATLSIGYEVAGPRRGSASPAPSQRPRPSSDAAEPAAQQRREFQSEAAAATEAAASLAPDAGFLSDEGVTFESLGAHPRVAAALQALELSRPTRVQELAVPAILSQADVVLAAETGSGKTLSYLVPLLTQLLNAKEAGAAAGGAISTLVLCPNAALCAQVVEVAQSLVDAETGEPLLAALAVSSAAAPPEDAPDLLVATPNGLMSKLREWSETHRRWTKEGFPKWIRHVVADEADLLLAGGFVKDLSRLLEVFRLDDRARLRLALCERFGMSEEEFLGLKFHVRRAAYNEGAEGMLASEGFSPQSDSGQSVEELGFWRRQYLFVAATMPGGGKGSAAADLRKRYPDAQWLNGNLLHMTNSLLAHEWEAVTDKDKKGTLRRVVTASLASSDSGRILLFVNSVQAAEQVAALVGSFLEEEEEEHSGGGAPRVLCYHRDVSNADRKEALRIMREDGNAIMVCTDSAARGIDIPGVTHVIQAEFALSAVDFIHRAGRTARAGAAGRITSMYTAADAALVAAIRQAIMEGVPVEKAFSRKRSFRKKIRKYGEQYATSPVRSASS
mmetsp:Transcript_19346/g.48730  ORF Transcript_19346/g.48730 Transcript_19346/m.48730 type:complete len:625 (+) Transcript_19346:130-2004(+)